MKLEFESVYGTKFNSFEEFELEIQPGKHLVLGEVVDANQSTSSNGSGKSSIFESLVWTAFKRYNRGKDPSKDYQGNCITGTRLRKNNQHIQIERGHKLAGGKSSLQVKVDEADITARTLPLTETQVQGIIGMEYDLFVSTCVVLQGMPVNFTQLTGVLRKSIVEGMLGYSVFDKYKKRATDRKKLETNEFNARQATFNATNQEMIQRHSELETLKTVAEDSAASNDAQAAEIQAKLTTVQAMIATLRQNHEHFQGHTANTVNSMLIKMTANLGTLNQQYANVQKMITDGKCFTCGQGYSQEILQQKHQEQMEIFNQLNSMNAQVQPLQKSLEQLTEIESQLNNHLREESTAKSNLAMVENSQKRNYGDEIKNLDEVVEHLFQSVNEFNRELEEQKEKVESVAWLEKQLVPSSEFRAVVLKKHLNQISLILATLSPFFFGDILVKLGIDKKGVGIDIILSKSGKKFSIDSLSGGEKKRLDILLVFAFQKFVLQASGTTSNLVVLDEIFDGLDVRGLEMVVNCLESIYPPETAIYVISHNEILKAHFNSIVRVNKLNNTSRIV